MLHYSCRDRTLIGMQSDLVGAHAMGMRNVLLTTGNPAPQATYADATSVFDVDAIGLINMVCGSTRASTSAGSRSARRRGFHIGVAVNPFAPDPDAEWRRLDHKVEAGAEFIVTPPMLDIDGVRARCCRACAGPGCRWSRAWRRSRACATPSSWRAKWSACASPNACSTACAAPAIEAAEAHGDHVEIGGWLRERVDGSADHDGPRIARDRRARCFRSFGRRPCVKTRRREPDMRDAANGTGLREHMLLFSRFLRSPRTVGAVTASSRALAEAMVGGSRPDGRSRVVELGPGTGAFTSAIVERLGPDTRFLAIDIDPAFCQADSQALAEGRVRLRVGRAISKRSSPNATCCRSITSCRACRS